MSLSARVEKSEDPLVLTVTLNPMLDKTLWIDRLQPGTIMRASSMKAIAGGKGVNVSRVLRSLGVDTLATGFLGGKVGEEIRHLLAREGIPADFVSIRSTTREGFTFLDQSDGTATAIFEPPHQVKPMEARRLREKFRWLAARGHWAALSGSIPCAGLEGLYAELIREAHDLDVRVVLDSYDEAFAQGVDAGPFLVKPNWHELERTYDIELDSETALFELVDRFHQSGVRWVVVSDGARPAVVSVEGRRWRAVPPRVETVNPVGSGDAMVAGFLYAFLKEMPVEEVIRHGMAAGAANARVWDAGTCTRQDLQELVPQVGLERI